MKQIKKLSWFFLALILCGIFSTTGTSAVHAASIKATKTTLTFHTLREPIWAQHAETYIHIVNHLALIDITISQKMSASEVKLVRNAVKDYNNLPLSLRQKGTISGSSTFAHVSNNRVLSASCCDYYQWTLNWYWWGVRLWLSNYAAQNFGIAMGVIGAGIGTAIGAGIGAVPGAIIGAIVGAISGGLAAFVNNECGDQGIFIDIDWFLDVNINPVC